jgi:hypothetical protein
MATLTLNQQDLINQIIAEFMQHNEVSEGKKTKSLLGVDEIMDSVKRKNQEIARIRAHNKAVFKALEPIFEENINALNEELNALGLDFRNTSEWWENQDGKRHTTMKISVFSDRSSDFDFYFDARITGACLKWENETIWSIVELNPVLLYSYRDETYTFEQLCKNPHFIGRIKRMYETKNK